MKVLIVANFNTGNFSPFVTEQVNALKLLGVEFKFYGVRGKGIYGYLSKYHELKKEIRLYRPDLIHAHYGLCGLLANLQRKVPVVTTYHGSDIHSGGRNILLSRIAIRLSAYNIFVSSQLLDLSGYKGKNVSVIPCGIDAQIFKPEDRNLALRKLGWDDKCYYILFAGSCDNPVKNYELAKESIEDLKQRYQQYRSNVVLVELKGYSRPQVATLMNAANCLLLTSHREGSPQVIKEAMMCNCPIVSVDVGDVANTTKDTDGCCVVSATPYDISSALSEILERNIRTMGRDQIIKQCLTNDSIAKRIMDIYNAIKGKKLK